MKQEDVAEREKSWQSPRPALGNEMKNVTAKWKAQLRVEIEDYLLEN